MTTTDEKEPINQCKSCPWRVDCVPIRDIPNYVPDMHCNLDKTIRKKYYASKEHRRLA